ncbi:uncharacterized protein LOC124260390 [Haliotis rubra]|uniref:uncharacterized protein LOC124260390 n=1 Tax=Haliotis rubra TaxID=36100 RepID=UPI001EE51742|nr:uncharacterized protein LOC124260390 [Haliotis rubra]
MAAVMILLVVIFYASHSRQNVVAYMGKLTEGSVQKVDGAHSNLLKLYQKKLGDLQKSNLWSTIPNTPTCTKKMHPSTLCTDPDCRQDIPEQPVVRLKNVLNSMRSEDLKTVKRINQLKELQVQHTRKQILFLTGSSSNHFMESQAMLKNFHETIPAVFSNYSLRYYDLGLTQAERAQVEKHCKCDVKIFPLQKLDKWMRRLECYIWKPIIIQANIKAADIVVWMDTSIRLPTEGLKEAVMNVPLQGLTIGGWGGRAPTFIDTRMINYFNTTACIYAPFTMVEANFMMFHNEEFVRDAIIAPWMACAVNHNCMCPDKSILYCNYSQNKYGICHRYDQAAINVIAMQLFGKHIESLQAKGLKSEVKRGDSFAYFKYLDSQSKQKGT